MRVHPASIAIVLLAGLGCRPRQSAGDVALADDIDQIERALAERQAELESEGIVVASRTGDAADAAGVAGPPAANAPAASDDEVATEAPVDQEFVEPTMSAPSSSSDVAKADRQRERALGVSDRRSDAARRCERICDLAESTCALGERICTLASRHIGDPRYALACGRAQQQCTAVREHCDGC